MAQKNSNLHAAKSAKNDEFYTQLTDIEKELKYYKQHFKGKVVLCNCDDPTRSEFWRYFHLNFSHLGLKKLISTHYDLNQPTYKLEYTGGDDNDIEVGTKTPLMQNGDFRSPECVELLKEADIVVTNPPFSCYSSDTEVMTNGGWKLIRDVDINVDIIMSLNPETKNIEMVKAVDYLKSPVKGELYHFKSRNMDFCVTGNHKMYSYYKNCHSENILMEPTNAEDIKAGHLLPLTGFNWKGKDKSVFILPETTQIEQYSRKTIAVPEKRIDMKCWLEFFGFWLADGCWRDHINTYGKRDYTISIKQNQANEQYVLGLIEKIGFTANVSRRNDGNHNYTVYSKQLWEYLQQFGRSANKFIPREYLELDTPYLEALLRGYQNGDSANSLPNTIKFSSRSKVLIENVQELILKTRGQITNIRTVKSTYRDQPYIYCIIHYTPDLKHRDYAKYGKPTMVPYDDNVYCLTLERNHIMLTRHNGVIGWCGNCFREYVAQLMEYNKQFLIIGNQNAITYKEIFSLFIDEKIWLGCNHGDMSFKVPDYYEEKATRYWVDENGQKWRSLGNICWFTNLDHAKRHEELILRRNYNSDNYPKYDNYDAINVNKVEKIPCDYFGCIGVPITFLTKHNPQQFKIVKFRKGDDDKDLCVNGQCPYFRIIIRKVDDEKRTN